MTPDPTKMAEHLKELGPETVAKALCAAYAAMGPLCKHHAEPAKPASDAPKEIGDIASQMRGSNEKGLGMGVEDETAVVAETPPVEVSAPAAPEPAAPGPAPWSKELEEYFPDADVRAKVDSYIREKRQPYVTKLEQERADLAERAAWHDDLSEDPDGTLHDAITQKYGDDAGAKFLEMIDAGATPAAAVAEAKADALDPDDREVLEFAKKDRQQRALNEYLGEVAKVKEAHPHVRDRAFHLYVKEHGTIEDATAAYLEDYPAPVAEVPPTPPAPPTLTGGGGSTPVSAAYASLDDLGAALFAAASGR